MAWYFKGLVGFGLLMLGACVSGSVSADNNERSSLADLLAGSVYVQKSAGLSFAAYRDGEIVETGAYGVTDIETGTPMRADTPTRLASITKPIAAALLLNAAHEEPLSLQTPIWNVAPEFAGRCERIKSFFLSQNLHFMDGITCGDETVSLDRVISHTASAPAGSVFAYNGFLYGRLEEPIYTAYGAQSLEPVVRKQIIDPLGLAHAAAGVEDAKAHGVINRLARPHKLTDGNLSAQPFLDDEINAGAGMIASAPDAARILMAIFSHDLFSELLLDDFIVRPQLADGGLSPYGRGIFVETLNGRETIWHTGWQPDAYTGLWIHDVNTSTGIVILLNTDLQEETGDFAGSSLKENGLARVFMSWLTASQSAN